MVKNKSTKTLRILTKVLLFVCVLAVSSFSTYADEQGSLTFKLPTDMQSDLNDTSISVDLYQVATYDNGVYTNTQAFEGITWSESDAMQNVEAVQAVLDKTTVDVYKTVTVGEKTSGIDLGYYYYVVQEDVEGKAYTYTFNAGLVSIPSTDVTTSTLNTDREIDLKGTREEKKGSIKITKTLKSWNQTSKECTFVFEITGKDSDGKVVYSNVASISFNEENHGSDSVIVEGIPVGTKVTVKEVYSGGYVATVVDEEEKTVVLDETIEFNFENDYNNYKDSYGVENQFTWDKEWHWHAKDPKGLVKGESE